MKQVILKVTVIPAPKLGKIERVSSYYAKVENLQPIVDSERARSTEISQSRQLDESF